MCTATNILLIVTAIWHIEGGAHTRFPYGIRSVDTRGNVALARHIATTTVRNNLVRWRRAGSPGCFLDFLADRYCPPQSDQRGNKRWKVNIKRRLNHATIPHL